MFARLCHNRQRVFGVFLIGVALAAFFSNPPGDWKYLQLAVWLVGVTWGYLLLGGVVGTHPAAARRRNRNPSLAASPVEPVLLAPREFRYGSTRRRRAMAAGVCVALGVGQIALGGILGAALWANSAGAGLFCGGGLALWGLILCDYARRYLRVCIRVDAEGITSQLYCRKIGMRWDEVVALVRQRCVMPMAFGGGGVTAVGGLDAGLLYLVYSHTAKIWFSDSLVDAQSLVQVLSQQTNLPWERGDGARVN